MLHDMVEQDDMYYGEVGSTNFIIENRGKILVKRDRPCDLCGGLGLTKAEYIEETVERVVGYKPK